MPTPSWKRGLADPRPAEERAAAAAAKKASPRLSAQEQADLKEAEELREARYKQVALARRRAEDWAMRREVENQLAALAEQSSSTPSPSFLARDAARVAREEAEKRKLAELEQASPSTFARTIGYAPASVPLGPIPESAYTRYAELGQIRTPTARPAALPPHIAAEVAEATRRATPTLRSIPAPMPAPAPARASVRPLPPPIVETVLPRDAELDLALASTQRRPPSRTPANIDVEPPTIRNRYAITTPYQQVVEVCGAEAVRRAIAAHDGNKAAAARALGLTREGLYGILRRSGWSIPESERAKHARSGAAGAAARWS